jgi:hypothetical protein
VLVPCWLGSVRTILCESYGNSVVGEKLIIDLGGKITMKLPVILWNFSKKLCIKKGGCQRWGKFEYLLIFGGCKWAGAKLAGKLKN